MVWCGGANLGLEATQQVGLEEGGDGVVLGEDVGGGECERVQE